MIIIKIRTRGIESNSGGIESNSGAPYAGASKGKTGGSGGLALVLKQSSKENKAMLKQQKSIKNSYMDKLSLEIDEQDNFMTEVESEFVEIN
jgi:hypothetical protein